MTGLLALMGGREHTPRVRQIDRALLADAGVSRPKVAVLLAGTSPRRRAFKMNEALRHWEEFGGQVSFAFSGESNETARALEALEDPDLIVFTGGHPWLLHRRMDTNPQVLERVVELWRAGVPVSGSSAGAMALCEWRQRLGPPRPFQIVRAFGLVPGSIGAPHFPQYGIPRLAEWVVRRHPQLQVLGLSEATALVGREGVFRVVGEGTFTLLSRDRRLDVPAGADIALA